MEELAGGGDGVGGHPLGVRPEICVRRRLAKGVEVVMGGERRTIERDHGPVRVVEVEGKEGFRIVEAAGCLVG
ncbi:MAG: hypothetical protein HYY13_02285 [Nitrospirae bacterium]|nr:hypothetical protein [Nitrospirota bacterium]